LVAQSTIQQVINDQLTHAKRLQDTVFQRLLPHDY
jgi:hypothetical protein